jgi:hypothetical protein
LLTAKPGFSGRVGPGTHGVPGPVTELQILGKVRRDFFGRGLRGVSGDDLARSIDEELFEVPGDGVGVTSSRLFVAEPLVQIAGSVAVHIDLGKHGERGIVLTGCKCKYFGIGAGLLPSELVAREGQHVEPGCLVVFIECTQTCVLRGKPSSTRDVDNQADLILVPVEADGFPGNGIHREVSES